MNRLKSWLHTDTPAFARYGAVAYAVALIALMAPGKALAQGASPVQPIVDVVFAIATVVVQIVVLVSLALAAIGFAQGAVSAQWANNIGSSIGLSQAWTRIIMTAVLAALSALVPIVIGIAAEAIRPYVNTDITLPRW